MSPVDDARYEREDAHDSLTRTTDSLTNLIGEASTASKLSIERKIEEAHRRWESFKGTSRVLLDKQKVKSRTDPLYATEKQIVDDAYKAMDDILNKAHDRIAAMDLDEKKAETVGELSKLQSLVDDSKERVNGRLGEVTTGIEEVTGVADLGKLNMYVGWLNATEKIVIYETLPAIDNVKAVTLEEDRLAVTEARTTYQQEILKNIRELHVKVVEKRKEVAPEVAAGPHGAEASGARPANGGFNSMANLYTKIPLPKFEGQLRNFPMFKKRWKMGPGTRFSEDDQILHIISQVPKTVEPRLKNCQSMAQVWRVLDEEYNQPLDLVNEVIRDLVDFKFSKTSTSDAQQFMELFDKYEQAKNDLEEAKAEEELNSLSLITKIVNKFPKAIYNEYGRYRVSVKASRDRESVKFDAFMNLERANQKELLRFDTPAPTKPQTEDKKCSFCHKKGHKREDCWQLKGKESGKKVNHAGITKPQSKPCPVCSQQHTFNARGKTLYKSRLSACDAFRNKSVEERATVVENCGGCALCLDWTGNHKRDACDAKVGQQKFPWCDVNTGSGVCGRNHNKLLHGNTRNYCMTVQNCRVVPTAPARVIDVLEAPTEQDLIIANADTLLPIQTVPIKGRGAPVPASVFWDKGSTTVLVRRLFAEQLKLPGRPCTQYIRL